MENNNNFKPYVPADKVTPELTITSVVIGILLAVIFQRAYALYLAIDSSIVRSLLS